MSEENVFEYLSEPAPLDDKSNNQSQPQSEDQTQFIKELPEWDLEPPYEIIRRKQL